MGFEGFFAEIRKQIQIYRILLISKDPYNDVVKSCFWTGISEIVNRVQERMTQKLTIIYIMALLEIYYKNIEVDRRGISMTLPPRKETLMYRNN